MDWNPATGWLETCNVCDAAPAVRPSGHCAECWEFVVVVSTTDEYAPDDYPIRTEQ